MADTRVIYLGKSAAIDANALEAFTPSEVHELLAALEGLPHLRDKVWRARDWVPEVQTESDESDVDLRELVEEALTEPTLGPASDRDSAQYWANLARKMAREIFTVLGASQQRFGNSDISSARPTPIDLRTPIYLDPSVVIVGKVSGSLGATAELGGGRSSLLEEKNEESSDE